MKRQLLLPLILTVALFLAILLTSGCAYAKKSVTADKPGTLSARADSVQKTPATQAPLAGTPAPKPFSLAVVNPQVDKSGPADRETKSEYWTFLWPRGPSPAEALAKEGDVNLTEEGIQIGKTKWTWWDTAYTRVHDFLSGIFWWGVAVGVVLLILLLLPQTSAITSGILKSIVGFFTPMVGWFQAKAAKRQRDEIIYGGEAFKKAILLDKNLTSEQKENVLATFRATQMGEQNGDTQTLVKDVTA